MLIILFSYHFLVSFCWFPFPRDFQACWVLRLARSTAGGAWSSVGSIGHGGSLAVRHSGCGPVLPMDGRRLYRPWRRIVCGAIGRGGSSAIDALIHALIKLCIDSCFNRDWWSTLDPDHHRLRNMQINPARSFYQRSHQSMARFNLHIYQLLLRSIRYLVHIFTNHGLIRCINLCVSTPR